MQEKYRMITKVVRNMNLSRTREKFELNDTESETLRYITKHEGCIGNDIVNYLGVDKALISRVLKRLEALKYIEIKEGEDKRCRSLYPTSLGLNLKLDHQLYEIDYYKSLFEDIDDSDKDVFFRVLKHIYDTSKQRRLDYEKEKKIR